MPLKITPRYQQWLTVLLLLWKIRLRSILNQRRFTRGPLRISSEIIAFVQALIEKGYAYESAGDAYYRARKFKKYGQLSDQRIDDLEVGASQHTADEETDRKKIQLTLHSESAKPGEISWESPWVRVGWLAY